MSGTSVFFLILCVFLVVTFKKIFSRPEKVVKKDDDFDVDDTSTPSSDLSLNARREPTLARVKPSPAVATQKKPVAAPVATPRGATRVKSRPSEIDYSIFDVPTFKRRAIQLSF